MNQSIYLSTKSTVTESQQKEAKNRPGRKASSKENENKTVDCTPTESNDTSSSGKGKKGQ